MDSAFYPYAFGYSKLFGYIFVAETLALESIDAECEKQEAGIYHVIYSLVTTKT